MVTILRLKRQRNALPIDEINCESKKIKLENNEDLEKTSFYRFISNNVKFLPDILKRIKKSKVIKKIPTFVDVKYEDVADGMEWEQSDKPNDYVYDYYCTEDLEIVKQEIIDLMSHPEQNSDDELNNYESDDDSNDENYWGNEYFEEEDVILRCANFEDEDVRDYSSDDSDSMIIRDYNSDCSGGKYDYCESDISD